MSTAREPSSIASSGFSNVLIEALVCECAVLCTEHKSGAKELFGDDEYGLLVAVNDEDALFEGLQTMCEDKHLRQEYEKKAHKSVNLGLYLLFNSI